MGQWRSTKCPNCGQQGSQRESNEGHPGQTVTGRVGSYMCENMACRVDFYRGDCLETKEGW